MAEAAQKHYQAERIKVPFVEYLDLDAINATRLKDMSVSPRLYDFRRKQPRPDNDTLRVGRACHTAILEPRRFLKEYVLWDSANGRRYGKKWDAFKEANASKTILTEKQYDLALTLSDRVREHAVAGDLLAQPGECEATITWQHSSGLRCKSRLDWWTQCGVIADVKTTRNPDPGKFAADCVRYGYDLQFAFYADAASALTGEAHPFRVIAVQNVEPYDVVLFDVPEAVLAIGREKYEAAIARLIECTEANRWPGIAEHPVGLVLPAWATPEAEELELTFNGEAL